MNRWYVVQTHYRNENMAKLNLMRQGFDVYLPLFSKSRRHARKTTMAPAPFFPRYLFVSMDIELSRWRAVRSTIGVTSLICHGERPSPLADGVIDAIRAREDERGMVKMNTDMSFQKGAPVKVMAGAFNEMEGLFDRVNDDRRVFILLNLLGRETRVQLPLEYIRACA